MVVQRRGKAGDFWLSWVGGGTWGRKRRLRGGQPEVHPAMGTAGDFRGELGLWVEGGAGLGGLDKEESATHTENVHASCLELI